MLTKTYINSNTTKTISSANGPVILYAVCVNQTATGTITFADKMGGVATTFAILPSSVAVGTYLEHTNGIVCAGDLIITTAGSPDLTILTSTC